MVKAKKKRNKTYKGVDASTKRPIITKVSAVNRSKPSQWWFEKKRFIKPVAKVALVLIIIIILILQIFRLAS